MNYFLSHKNINLFVIKTINMSSLDHYYSFMIEGFGEPTATTLDNIKSILNKINVGTISNITLIPEESNKKAIVSFTDWNPEKDFIIEHLSLPVKQEINQNEDYPSLDVECTKTKFKFRLRKYYYFGSDYEIEHARYDVTRSTPIILSNKKYNTIRTQLVDWVLFPNTADEYDLWNVPEVF